MLNGPLAQDPIKNVPALARCLLIAASLLLCPSARAATGAAVPWTTYEAEAMSISGGFVLGPSYNPNLVQSESSGRRCVRLNSTGAYAEFTAQGAANSLVVRYSVPDAAGGGGTDYTLSLYKNGTLIAKLPVTSKYSWLYGGYPFVNTPGSGARNFFDEVRTNNLSITNGDVLRLQKDASDSASFYDIDLVDLENVAVPLSQPGGSVSIKSAPYNAVGDGVTDDTSALQNCINANSSVWLPQGNYKITASINLPSNRNIRGAGMWYSTLVGDATLYTNSAKRVTLNGNGSNIQISDFAILGRLKYRNDSEPNDGIGGSFGTGSTISRLWVEHTKTGAWIVNSLGLVVDSCRFRNNIADGINCVVGMRNTTVTNCTARGTGDDCFAIWPATYLSPTYAPGLNVITHCTGQTPFLANGGAIYGGEGNRVEDCLFQDMTYGCGVLLSTTFNVSTNFSGTTVVQRCELNRCGGNDPGIGWRAALQLFLENRGVTGVNLNNLNITNSASDGLSVADGGGPLSNAIMSNVSIPNYGLGASAHHGLWARNDAIGSMTVSNCAIVEYQDDSPTFSFNFVTSTIPVTVQSSPSGRSFTVDGTSYTNSQNFNWTPGSSHTLATISPQSNGTGVQYVWSSWNDGGAISHTVTPGSATTYTANFTTQYFLTMNAGPGGSVSPASGWTNSGAIVDISASASNGYSLTGWTGIGSGSYSGTNSSASVTMNGPITQMATFITNVLVTIEASPTGRSFIVDGTDYATNQTFSWVPGSSHTIATTSPQSGAEGEQFIWNSWSDGGVLSHSISPNSNSTYTATFTTQYFLTMNTAPGGSVSPASGWHNSGTNVNISATSSNGYSFSAWTGSGTGSYSGSNNPASITVHGPLTQSASFDIITNSTPPSQSILAITVGESVTLSYATTAGFPYHIEIATNLTPAVWTTVPDSTTNATDTSVTVTMPLPSGPGPFYYRTVSP